MAKAPVFIVALALVLFVCAHSVASEESNPTIYDQIDKAATEVKDAVTGKEKEKDKDKEKEQEQAQPTPAQDGQSGGSWTSWFKNKVEGVFSGSSQSSAATGAPAPSPSAYVGSGTGANAPTAA